MNIVKMILGELQARRLARKPEIATQLREIAMGLASQANGYPRGLKLYMMVGYAKSGKETLIKSHEKLQRYFRISTDDIHDELNRAFDFLQDGFADDGKAFWLRQSLTQIVRKRILLEVFSHGISVVLDACNLSRGERRKRLKLSKGAGYDTTLIWVRCSEATLLERLHAADEEKKAKRQKRVWVNLYLNKQQKLFDPPSRHEADHFKVYWSDRNDPLPVL